jgi:hypothetical protein
MTEQSLIGLTPVGERVLVYIYDDGNNTIDIGGGKRLIVGLTDTHFDSLHDVVDGKHPGIRPRWAMVVGTNKHTPDSITLGDKVLLEQMKWRRGVFISGSQRVWDIAVDDIMVADDNSFTEEEMEKVVSYLAEFDEIDQEILADLRRVNKQG